MKESLHDLIRALSKSEKRYFKLFCQRESGGGNYLMLFNAIERQDTYDEQAIKKTFRCEPFVRQLHVTKNYLRNLILKTLRNYHANISKDAALKDVLRNVEILFNKELYRHCETELKKAASLAERYELQTGKIEVESWKRKLVQTLDPHLYAVFKETLDTQSRVIDALHTTNKSWQIAVEVTSGMFQSQENISVRNVNLKESKGPQTLEGRSLYYSTQYLLDLRNDDYVAAEKRLLDLIALLEEDHLRVTEEPGLYVSTINNLLSFYVFQKQHTEALVLIQKAKAVYDGWKITAANRTLLKQILRTYNIELELYRDSKTFGQAISFVESTEAFIGRQVQKIPKEYLVSFWFQLASIYFMRKNYNRALDWIHRILTTRFKGIRTDLQMQAQLLNLMVHLEQRNLMVLRYYVDSAKRYMKKVDYRHDYIDLLFKFFVRMGRLPVLEYKQAYRDLLNKLYPDHESSIIPKEAIGYIDFRMWLQEKV